MLKLIFAEIKKIILNKKNMISEGVFLLLFVVVFSFLFSSLSPTGLVYFKAKPLRSLTYEQAAKEIQTLKANIEMRVQEAKSLHEKGGKQKLTEIYQEKLPEFCIKINALLESEELAEFFVFLSDNKDNYYNEEIFKFFDKDLPYRQKLIELDSLIVEINEHSYENSFFIDKNSDFFSKRNKVFFNFSSIISTLNILNLINVSDQVNLDDESDKQAFFGNFYAIYYDLYNALTVFQNQNMDFFSADDLKEVIDYLDNLYYFHLSEEKYLLIEEKIITSNKSILKKIDNILEDLEGFAEENNLVSGEEHPEFINYSISAEVLSGVASRYIDYSIQVESYPDIPNDVWKSRYPYTSKAIYEKNSYLIKANYIIDNDLTLINNALDTEEYSSSTYGYNYVSTLTKFYMAVGKDVPAYLDFMFAGLALFLIMVATTLASETLTKDRKDGTLKNILTSPYKRWKILISKVLAIMLIMLALIFALALILPLVGKLFLGLNWAARPVIAVFNAKKVIILSPIIQLFIKIVFFLITMLVYVSISLFISTVFNSKTLAVLFNIFIAFEPILSIKLSDGIGKFLPFSNINLYDYFSGLIPTQSNFYFSVLMTVFYIFFFLFFACRSFAKKDID